MKKSEYTFRSLNSIITSLNQAKRTFPEVKFDIILIDYNSKNEDLEQIKQDLVKLSTEMSNTQGMMIKVVDRFNISDRTSQSHREDIVKELLETVKWIPPVERQGLWYEEYLDKVNKDLKTKNYENR